MAEDWPRLNGPHTNWLSNDKGLADTWPKEGPKTVWAVTNLGGGFGSPVVAGGKVFLIGRALDTNAKDRKGNLLPWYDAKCLPGPDVLTCLDRTDGKVLWTHEFNNVTNATATSWNTPAVYGDVLYARGGDGEVRCISVKDGKQIWAWPKPGEVLFTGKMRHKFGLASGSGCAASVVVCDGVLVAMGGSKDGNSVLVGLDSKTGAKLWNTDEFGDWQFGDRNHVVLNLSGKNVVLTHYMVLDVKTGAKVGSYTSPNFGFHSEWCSTFEGNRYYAAVSRSQLATNDTHYTKGHGQGMECLEFNLTADGSVTNQSKWQWFTDFKEPTGQVMEKGFSGPLLVDGHLYTLLGYKGNANHMICLDAATGQATWPAIATPPHPNFACMAAADGKIFYLNETGLLVMIAADPAKYRLLGTAQVVGRTLSSLALSDGFAFVRDDFGVLKCLDLKAP